MMVATGMRPSPVGFMDVVSRASEGDANSRVAICRFCGPVDYPAAAVTPAIVLEWTQAHCRTESHLAMERLADELDAAVYVPPEWWQRIERGKPYWDEA